MFVAVMGIIDAIAAFLLLAGFEAIPFPAWFKIIIFLAMIYKAAVSFWGLMS